MRKPEFDALDLLQGCEIADTVLSEHGESHNLHYMPNFQFYVQIVTSIYSPGLFDFAVSLKSIYAQSYAFHK